MTAFPARWNSAGEFVCACIVCIFATTPAVSSSQPVNKFLFDYCYAPSDFCSFYPGSIPTSNLPRVNLRGWLDIGWPVPYRSINSFVGTAESSQSSPPRYLYSYQEGSGGGSQCALLPVGPATKVNVLATRRTTWSEGGSGCGDSAGAPPIAGRWTFDDSFMLMTPTRRVAYDGSQYDAMPIVQRRNGHPWLTLHWGYRLGLVETTHDWTTADFSNDTVFANWPRFSPKSEEVVLVSLPPPWVEGEVTEYNNTLDVPRSPGGQYFYATTDAERELLDSGQTGFWSRTGKSFKAGGYVGVCRFYGSVSPGPNTHFYTASESECSVLKAMQVTPTPTDRQQIHFEGKTFQASTPIPPRTPGGAVTCPLDTIPLFRAYNAAWGPQGKRDYDSNHRFSVDRADIAEVVRIGWVDEGIVMCVPL
jgi:hypothetical protein